MHKLIMKDVLVQKRVFPYLLLYIPFALLTMRKLNSSSLYVIISLTIAYMLASNSFALEEVSQSGRVILSLPVSRKEVVMSKYISIFVYIAAAIIVMSAVGGVLNTFAADSVRLKYITITEIKSIIVSCTIICCIIFPLQFKLGYAKARIASIIVYIMLFSVVPILMDKLNNLSMENIIGMSNLLKSVTEGWIGIALLGVIWLASYFISLNFYENREV